MHFLWIQNCKIILTFRDHCKTRLYFQRGLVLSCVKRLKTTMTKLRKRSRLFNRTKLLKAKFELVRWSILNRQKKLKFVFLTPVILMHESSCYIEYNICGLWKEIHFPKNFLKNICLYICRKKIDFVLWVLSYAHNTQMSHSK